FLQVLFCLVDRTSQRQQDRLGQIALQVQQVRLVRYLEFCFGAADQPGSLIAGEQHDVDGKVLDACADGRGPGDAVAPVAVGLDQDEVGHRLDADQADVGAVEVLVGAQNNVFGRHGGGQTLAFLLGEAN